MSENNSMKVYLVDDEKTVVHERLGLSTEVLHKINKRIAESFEHDDFGVVESIMYLSEVCDNTQELAYAIFSYTVNVERRKQSMEKIKKLLSGLPSSLREKGAASSILGGIGELLSSLVSEEDPDDHDCEKCDMADGCPIKDKMMELRKRKGL